MLQTFGIFENVFARIDYNFNSGTVTHTDVHRQTEDRISTE
jgi:hypothetical protein